jgi:hypothetical protein
MFSLALDETYAVFKISFAFACGGPATLTRPARRGLNYQYENDV